ncbi:hypothetical protein PP359_07555 [Sphingomonas sp. BLCC-B65]|nr:hypothetical protein [Sphingomonas sp. BLCC-B65]
MAVTYASFSRRTRAKLKPLGAAEFLFLAAWSATHLDDTYGAYLDELEHGDARRVLRDAIDAAWAAVDTGTLDARFRDELSVHLTAVRDIDIDDLDFARPSGSGVLKLMEATEAALSIAVTSDPDPDDVLTALWAPVDVLNTIKHGGALRPETDPLDDAFFADELAAQAAVIADLEAQAALTSADRRIHRS